MGKIFSTPDFWIVSSCLSVGRNAYTKLDIDGEVVEIGTDLLLDSLTTGLGREVDVSLDSA